MKKRTAIWFVIATIMVSGIYSCNKKNTEFDPQGGLLPTNYVYINDSSFSPESLTVVSGSSITFVNRTVNSHQIISDDTVTLKSKILAIDSFYFFKKDTFGTFPYHCINHPTARGVITITP